VPTHTGALGQTVVLRQAPHRIVSLVPSLTEALFAFGAGERVAGITRYCTEPAEGVATKTSVGGTKNVDVGAVKRLDPDLVIANAEENTREDIQDMVRAGLTVFVTYPRTVRQAVAELRTLGAITGTSGAADRTADECEQALAETHGSARTTRVFCPIWRNPWMTAGRDTYISDLITVCGGENVFSEAAERYPRIAPSEVRARRPQAVLLPDEPYRFSGKHRAEVIEMAPSARIHYVDGKLLCWYGPRIPEALRYFRGLLEG
jgi:ABC-type Fe3+-hydroxamate transport system substrate-binding protein